MYRYQNFDIQLLKFNQDNLYDDEKIILHMYHDILDALEDIAIFMWMEYNKYLPIPLFFTKERLKQMQAFDVTSLQFWLKFKF